MARTKRYGGRLRIATVNDLYSVSLKCKRFFTSMEKNDKFAHISTDQLLKRKRFLVAVVVVIITILFVSVGLLIYAAMSGRWNVVYFVIPSLAVFISSIPLQYNLVIVLRELKKREAS